MFENLGIYLFILAAVAIGWLLGRMGPGSKRRRKTSAQHIFDEYFVGLNYLLNDEPDEAIDTFIKALEVNSDTIETHLALGALLRRRGKVDKAIKVHQTLLARPGLDQQFTDSTRLQLAIDYIAAGLLDRAERLLKEVLQEDTPGKWDALRHLITIYQTEKEWQQAVDCSAELLKNPEYRRNQECRAAAAHYCCELAELDLAKGQVNAASKQVRKGLDFDRYNVRASLLLAQIEEQQGNYQEAIRLLRKVKEENPEFTVKVLEPLASCYEQTGSLPEYESLLYSSLPKDPDISIVLALSQVVRRRNGDDAAIEFLNDTLRKQPSLTGLVELLRLQIPRADAEVSSNLSQLQALIDRLLSRKPAYRCNHCGYESKNLYWLCPSCQKWDRIKPIVEAGLP